MKNNMNKNSFSFECRKTLNTRLKQQEDRK